MVGYGRRRLLSKNKVTLKIFSFFAIISLTISGFGAAPAYAASVTQVSTGATFACAVDNGVAKCWGTNEFGELGNRSTTDSTSPVKVYAEAATAASTGSCGGWFQPACSPAAPASPIHNKFVEKVSVGLTHACALADAKVYCWGDNSRGQLGNRSNVRSTIPVAVDIQSKDITPPPYKETSKCGGWFQPACKTITPPMKPKSSLSTKEVIDIATGEYFSCALASDGAVSCWGEGENGRLGTNSTNDTNYPKAVYSAGALNGRKGIKLAKANGATMCVLTVAVSFSDSTSAGSPYCWGFGIDDGSALPPNGAGTVACGKNSPTLQPSESSVITETIYSESSQPVKVPSENIKTIKGYGYMTALDTNGRASYWGMYGIKAISSAFTDIKSCTINTCLSATGNRIKLAATAQQQKDKAKKNAQNNNKPGGDKNKNLNSNNTAQKSAQNAANGGNYTSVSGNYVSSTSGTGVTTGSYSYQTGGTSFNATVQQNGSGGISFNVNNYAGVARPSNSNTQSANVGDNKAETCGNETHYGFNKYSTFERVGKNAAGVPPLWPQSSTGIAALSGNAYDGLFCAKLAAGTSCDAHGTSMNEGQTGSGYSQQCTGGTLFTPKVCQPAPTGPQTVTASGWLAGKTITDIETGTTGYSCAIASGSVGCWGLNNDGQLGNGSKANKNVPTAVMGLQ